MQVLKAENDASGVENGTGLCKHVGVDVHHKITASSVLHHETDVSLLVGDERNMEIRKKERECNRGNNEEADRLRRS